VKINQAFHKMVNNIGGLAGHLAHLYDNPNLTFGQIKDVLKQASGGKLLGTEKTDGINLFLSFSNKDGKAKAARNKSNIKSGGLDANGLIKKFSDRPNMSESFKEAMSSWEQAISQLHPSARQKIFGNDAEIYYNVEILDPGMPNVIQYDNKNLLIHQTGHAFFDRETGHVKDVDILENYNVLKTAIDKIQTIGQPGNFNVVNDAVRTLKMLDSKKPLHIALSRLSQLQEETKISDKQTVGEYISLRVAKFLKKEIPGLTPAIIRDLTNKILGTSGLRIDKILERTPDEQKQKVKAIADNPAFILKKAIAPLEDIIHDFSVEALKGLESAFILDNDKEVKRLRGEITQAVATIERSGQDEAISILKRQLEKLKTAENIFTASEGFVFVYDGITYKFTGNFAPINQILGMFKYGRGKIPPLKDIIKESDKNRIISLVPGGFKPPHIGHYLGVKYLSDFPNIDEVRVVISPKSRFDSLRQIEITEQKSAKIWKIFTQNDPKVKILISKVTSPVRDVYDMMSEMNPGDTLVLALGEKDLDDTRFSRAQEWSDKNNLGVKIKTITTNVGKYSNISATKIRDLIANNDKQNFFKLMPTHLSTQEKEQVWMILIDKTMKKDNKQLDEMSAMGATAGSIEGSIERTPTNFSKKRIKGPWNEMDETVFIDRRKIMAEMMLRNIVKNFIKESLCETLSSRERATNILREQFRRVLVEAKSEVPDTVHPSTGINILEELLKKIISQLEQDYKTLTSSKEQRLSFRAHILNAVNKTLTTADINQNAGGMIKTPEDSMEQQVDEISVNVGDEQDSIPDASSKFIDVDGNTKKFQKLLKKNQNFSIPGKNETGRNMAMTTYDKLEKNILDSYNILSDNEDQKVFYDYLMVNLRMYFDKFEGELTSQIEEPNAGSDITNSFEDSESEFDNINSEKKEQTI